MADLMTISEMAERCGVATSAIRYYERRGLISSTRTAGNQRRFSRETIRRIAFIGAARAVGRSLDDIDQALASLPSARTPNKSDWGQIAASWRPQLDAEIQRLSELRDKLDACIGCGCLSLDSCGIYNANDTIADRGPGPRYLLGDKPIVARPT